MSYELQRAFGDSFLGHAYTLIAPHILGCADFYADTREATDIVIVATDVKISFRMRSAGVFDSFGHEFTLRTRTQNGNRSEAAKILGDGFADWLFYGYASSEPGIIGDYALINLDVLRQYWRLHHALKRRGGPELLQYSLQDNLDQSGFIAFDLASFVERDTISGDLIIAASERVNQRIEKLKQMRLARQAQTDMFQ